MPYVTESSPNRQTTRWYRTTVSLGGRTQTTGVTDHIWIDQVSKPVGDKRNYRKMISEGSCATTPLSARTIKHSVRSGSASGRVQDKVPPVDFDTTYYLDGNFLGTPGTAGTPSHLTAKTVDQSLIRYYRDLAAKESKFKGLVFAGELKETLMMLKSPFKSLRDSLGGYLTSLGKRGRRYPRKDRAAFVRKTWLEYSYGVAPLVSDCDAAYKQFLASKALEPLHEMARGKAESSELLVLSQNQFVTDFGPIRVTQSLCEKYHCIVKHYGVYSSRGVGISGKHTWGFSPWEFVPTLWELIPGSFLVDYFSNVGGVLESWSYRFLQPNFTSRTIVRIGERELVGKIGQTQPSDSAQNIYAYGDGGSHMTSQFAIDREPNVGTPLPSLGLQVPGRWSTWTNLAALSAQARATSRRLREN